MRTTLTILSLITLLSLSLRAGETKSLFDGKTLKGWKTVIKEDTKYWSVVDGIITGGDGVQMIPHNSFLRTIKEYGDFEFRCLFRLTGDPATGLINSGVQYRSTEDGEHMIGYQADIGNKYWGDIYDEQRRKKALLKGDLSVLPKLLDAFGWNSYIVRCKGKHHETYINGVKVADYLEKDPSIPSKGFIGIQLHKGGNAKIEISDVTVTEL
jgi:hypothetical protein